MKSSEPILDLEAGLPTTAEDVAAQQRAAASSRKMSFQQYLEFLSSLPEPAPEVLRRRRGPRGDPFTL